MATKKENKDLEEKYMQLQMLVQETKELQGQLESAQNQLSELLSLQANIFEIKKVKKGTSSYSRVGPGIFVESEIKNTDHVLVTVGANIIVRKTIEETKKLLDKQIGSLQEHAVRITQILQRLSVKAQQLESELESLAR